MKENSNEETHPWKWFVPKGAKILILGTFPPTKRNWSYDFFYPNKNNLFWRIMALTAKTELQFFSGEAAVNERKQILEDLGMGISDMGFKICRRDNSSLDENISVVEFMDLFSLLDENPGIEKIILTSSSGKSSAAAWFVQYFKMQGRVHQFPKGSRPLKSEFIYQDKKIEVVILYSPSARAANRITFDKMVELYQNEIDPAQHLPLPGSSHCI